MFDKLRWRFVWVAVVAVAVVLAFIIAAVAATNHKRVRVYADKVLVTLAEGDGEFGNHSNMESPVITFPKVDGMTTETPYETRYFVVRYASTDGVWTAIEVNTRNIASVNDYQAIELGDSVVTARKEQGYVKSVYRYLVYDCDDGTKLTLFMDCSRQLATLREFSIVALIMSLAGLMAVFMVALIISRRAVKPIADAYEKQKSFITDASHELKTPLALILANNEMLEMEYGENENTKSIAKQILRLNTMTKNLTMLSKIDEGEAMKDSQAFNLSETILDVLEPYYAVAGNTGTVITTDIAENIMLTGNEMLIRQMLSLILDNAVKYGKNSISIKASKQKNNIVLEFQNDTDGVEQGNLKKYFDRFYRSESARASGTEGSGIGLSIVNEIVGLHKGRATAEGLDNTFTLRIEL